MSVNSKVAVSTELIFFICWVIFICWRFGLMIYIIISNFDI